MGEAVDFLKLQKNWEQIIEVSAGEKFKKRSKPVKIKNRTLMVDCTNSVWANEFLMRRERILKEVNGKFKKLKIEKIVFVS